MVWAVHGGTGGSTPAKGAVAGQITAGVMLFLANHGVVLAGRVSSTVQTVLHKLTLIFATVGAA